MSLTRLTVSNMMPYFLYVIGRALEDSDDPELKKGYEKIFRYPGLRKFILENRQFMQEYKIFINSINNLQQTRIEIFNDTGEQVPDEKPSPLKRILKTIQRLTGLQKESNQIEFLNNLLLEIEKQNLNENTCEKYLT
jgi:hypothetical protein